MKTRDVYEILKEIKSKGYGFHPDILKPNQMVETMLLWLDKDENVVDYIFDDYLIKALFLITDKYRLIGTNITTTTTSGVIFDRSTQEFEVVTINMLGFREKETDISLEKGAGFFATAMDRITVCFDDGSFTFLAKKGKGEEVYRTRILNKLKRYIKKASAEMEKAEKPTAKTSATKTAKSSSKEGTGGEAIREIRKMHEDGLITKEEMMELLKLQVGK